MIRVTAAMANGHSAVVTFTPEIFMELLADAKFFGVEVGSMEFGYLMKEYIENGKSTGFRETTKSLKEVHEELKVNFPDSVFLAKPRKEDAPDGL